MAKQQQLKYYSEILFDINNPGVSLVGIFNPRHIAGWTRLAKDNGAVEFDHVPYFSLEQNAVNTEPEQPVQQVSDNEQVSIVPPQNAPKDNKIIQPSSNSLLNRAGEMWMKVFQFYNSIGGPFMQWNVLPLLQTPLSLAQQGIGWAMGVLPFRPKPVITYQKGLEGIEIDTRTLIGSRVDKLRGDRYSDTVIYVALDNNKIIGVAVIKPTSDDGSRGQGELFEVDPLYRSEPVALQLMNMVLSDPQWDEITFTIDPNYSRIVNPSLFGGSKYEITSKLIRFYEGFGFKQPDPQILEMEWRRN
jgi:hypothetical protein